jgi:stage III sporulation protein AA
VISQTDRSVKRLNERARFYEATALLPPFANALQNVPAHIAENACEIRIRAGRPVVVETPSERYVCRETNASGEDIHKCVKFFCDYSLYSRERELAEGRITLKGGHRAGFTGTALMRGGELTALRDISSVNLRIAAEHKGIAEKLMSLTVFERDLRGLLLLGAPMSAKTTMLRDLARLISAFARTSVIDENGEIAAMYNGVPQNDVGLNCDVLDMFPKAEGIMRAVRLMSPEYLICDEVGGEYRALAEQAGKGVKMILSAHCGDMREAACNAAVRTLVSSGAVNYIALLGCGSEIGNVKGLWRVNDAEDIGGCGNSSDLYRCGSRIIGNAEKKVRTAPFSPVAAG